MGPLHPDVATSLNNLAGLYREQGKYAKAESLYLQTLHIWTQLEPLHPNTAIALNNLAKLYCGQGKCIAAKQLYQRALAILK